MASSNSSDTSSNTIGRTPTPPPPPSPLVSTTHFATPPRQTWDVAMAPLQAQQQGAGASIGVAGNILAALSEENGRGNTATRPRLPSLAPLLVEADLMTARAGAAFNAINGNTTLHRVDQLQGKIRRLRSLLPDLQHRPRLPSLAPLLAEADLMTARAGAAFNALTGNAAMHRVGQLQGRIQRLRTLLPDLQLRHQVHRRANADAIALATLNTRANLAAGPALGSAQRRREERTRMIWDSVRGERVSLALFDARYASAGFMVLACRLARRIELRVRRVRRRLERARVGRGEEVDRVREWVEYQEMEMEDEELVTDFE